MNIGCWCSLGRPRTPHARSARTTSATVRHSPRFYTIFFFFSSAIFFFFQHHFPSVFCFATSALILLLWNPGTQAWAHRRSSRARPFPNVARRARSRRAALCSSSCLGTSRHAPCTRYAFAPFYHGKVSMSAPYSGRCLVSFVAQATGSNGKTVTGAVTGTPQR